MKRDYRSLCRRGEESANTFDRYKHVVMKDSECVRGASSIWTSFTCSTHHQHRGDNGAIILCKAVFHTSLVPAYKHKHPRCCHYTRNWKIDKTQKESLGTVPMDEANVAKSMSASNLSNLCLRRSFH